MTLPRFLQQNLTVSIFFEWSMAYKLKVRESLRNAKAMEKTREVEK